ncbi:MAG: exo-alpha-sialidase [Planctomycetaceae bacterium]|nr:exo-alpha-sialidase [Planctomycetaceae bacterium]
MQTHKKIFTVLSLITLVCFSVTTSFVTAQTVAKTEEIRPGLVEEEFIYLSAPYPQCHASTIVESGKGTLLAAWFGGRHEGHAHVGIWLARKINGKWSKPVEVANGKQENGKSLPCWNPVLFQPQNGSLMLFFKVGPDPQNWWGEWMISNDDGVTWINRQKLPNGFIGPVKNKPVEIDGVIFCPSSREKDSVWQIHLESSADNGKTWSSTQPLNSAEQGGTIQPSMLVYRNGNNPNGKLQMIARNRNGNGSLWQTWSEDHGKTWSSIQPLALPNPNSGIDAVTLKDGRQLLIYNHTNDTKDKNIFPRNREMLNLAVSRDGNDWQQIAVIECTPTAEFSYPSIIQTKDGMVHALYTWNRRLIKHIVFDPGML